MAVNLDHGGAFEDIIQAIHAGFSSVMIDRSTLLYEENVREVKEIVKVAHAVGVSVEAELGHVGQGDEYEETRDAGLTKLEEAQSYVEETGIDAWLWPWERRMECIKELLIWNLNFSPLYQKKSRFLLYSTEVPAQEMTILPKQ